MPNVTGAPAGPAVAPKDIPHGPRQSGVFQQIDLASGVGEAELRGTRRQSLMTAFWRRVADKPSGFHDPQQSTGAVIMSSALQAEPQPERRDQADQATEQEWLREPDAAAWNTKPRAVSIILADDDFAAIGGDEEVSPIEGDEREEFPVPAEAEAGSRTATATATATEAALTATATAALDRATLAFA